MGFFLPAKQRLYNSTTVYPFAATANKDVLSSTAGALQENGVQQEPLWIPKQLILIQSAQ